MFLLKFIFLLGFCSYLQATCPLYSNPITGLTYDIGTLDKSSLVWYAHSTTIGDIYFNFCDPVNKDCYPEWKPDTQAVCNYPNSIGATTYSFGEASSMVISPLGTEDGLKVTYTQNYTVCEINGKETDVSTEIHVSCDRLTTGKVLNTKFFNCKLTIEFASMHGCGYSSSSSPTPVRSPAPTPSPLPSVSITNANYQPIFGSDMMGKGYNLLVSNPNNPMAVGSPTQYRIFSDFNYEQNKTIQVDGETFSIPDEVELNRVETFGVKTYSYQSVADYLGQVSSNFGLSLDYYVRKIPIGVSATLTSLNNQMNSKGSVLSVSVEDIPMYQLNLYPNMPLSSDFISDVQSLEAGRINNQTFASKYGSQYQKNVKFGGQLASISVISGSMSNFESSMNLQVSAHVAFVSLKFPISISPFAGINKNTVPRYITTGAIYRIGGNSSLSSNDQGWYTKWVNSIPRAPQPIQPQIASIFPLMQGISASAASQYEAWLLDQLDSLDIPPVTSKNNDPKLSYSATRCTVPNGGLTSISLYYDDDDECQSGFWDVYSTSGATTTLNCKIPSMISWGSSRIFGSTPHALSTEELEVDLRLPNQYTSVLSIDNMNCGSSSYPCIPGLDSIGVGFDIMTGESRLPITTWTYIEGNTWESTYTNERFSYPDEIQLVFSASNQIVSKLYNSFQSYLESDTSTRAIGWNGIFFELGQEQQTVRRAFDAAQSVLGIAEELYTMYSLSVDNNIIASQDFNRSVSELPRTYERDAYFNFLSIWGTHYSSYASYGGKARMFSFVDQEYFTSYSSSDIQSMLGLSFKNWKLGVQWGTGGSSSTYQFSEESFQWVTFYGGAATEALTDEWSSWIESTHYSPAQIYKTLLPIQNLVADPTIANNIEQAVQEYANLKSVERPLPISLSMTLDWVSVTDSSDSDSIYSNYQDACHFTHSFGWSDVEYFPTSVDQVKYYFNVPPGYLAPEITAGDSNEVTPFAKATIITCPDDEWIVLIPTLDPCNGDTCAGAMGGLMFCSALFVAT